MSSVCISNCVNGARDPLVPVRTAYVNLYKWPESDIDFVRTMTRGSREIHVHGHLRVVDCISCRQMYLRSYYFQEKKINVSGKTVMCFGRKKEKKATATASDNGRRKEKEKEKEKEKDRHLRKRKCSKKISRATFFRIFHRLLSCTTSVDVVHGI